MPYGRRFAADAGGTIVCPRSTFRPPASAPQTRCNCPQRGGRSPAPWESSPGAGSPFGHQAQLDILQTGTRPKPLIRSVFGQSTIFGGGVTLRESIYAVLYNLANNDTA